MKDEEGSRHFSVGPLKFATFYLFVNLPCLGLNPRLRGLLLAGGAKELEVLKNLEAGTAGCSDRGIVALIILSMLFTSRAWSGVASVIA